MRRREFITVLSGIAAAWPLAVRAQAPGLITKRSKYSVSETIKRFETAIQ